MRSLERHFKRAQEQYQKVKLQTEINNRNSSFVTSANNYYDVKKKVFLFETDWLPLEEVTSERFFTSIGIVNRNRYVSWDVELGFIPNEWIPFIDVQIVYRTPGNPLNESFTTSFIFEQVTTSGNLTKISIIATIHIFKNGSSEIDLTDVESKLMVLIRNPHNFI